MHGPVLASSPINRALCLVFSPEILRQMFYQLLLPEKLAQTPAVPLPGIPEDHQTHLSHLQLTREKGEGHYKV